jgi:hypothetical protein
VSDIDTKKNADWTQTKKVNHVKYQSEIQCCLTKSFEKNSTENRVYVLNNQGLFFVNE